MTRDERVAAFLYVLEGYGDVLPPRELADELADALEYLEQLERT